VDESLEPLNQALKTFAPDIVFNLLEEFASEPSFDKNIVSYLELKNIPFTGCGPEGLFLCRDKGVTKKILQYHGIPTPKFQVTLVEQEKAQIIKNCKNLQFPLIVKSLTEEASLGISQASVVYNMNDLWQRVQLIRRNIGTEALIEEFVSGRELYVGAMEGFEGDPNIFPFWELDFGDLAGTDRALATRQLKFNAKFIQRHSIKRGKAKSLPEDVQSKILHICRESWGALGLKGYCRFDIRLSSEALPSIIEVNPNPELAKGEDFANAALQARLSYPDLIESLLEIGLRRTKRGCQLAV